MYLQWPIEKLNCLSIRREILCIIAFILHLKMSPNLPGNGVKNLTWTLLNIIVWHFECLFVYVLGHYIIS